MDLYQWFLLLVMGGECLSQCFNNADCTGTLITATDQRRCCVETNDGLSYNDGSTCNVCIVHGFLQTMYDVTEGSGLDTMFQLNVKGTTEFSGDLVISGSITAAADGTATESDFVELQPISVVNSAVVNLLTANDDITLEYDDRVKLTFTPSSADLLSDVDSLGEYIRDTATVNIVDYDKLEIYFEETDHTIQEGSNSPITLRFRNNQNPFPVTLSPVTVATAETKDVGFFINSDTIDNSTRATAADDFTVQQITVSIPANQQSFVIPEFLMAVDDNINEDEENFAVVAEIGEEVPDGVSCFLTAAGETQCNGRRGATRIRITDNDPMIIGFSLRTQSVSEGTEFGFDQFALQIEVEVLRTSEREHRMNFRYEESSSTATVEPVASTRADYDAVFGTRDGPNNPIEMFYDLAPERDFIPPLLLFIRNDFQPEHDEYFTIRIIAVAVPGHQELFTCNEDGEGVNNYFCEHTICIIDDDEPFLVAFVETVYTVDESVGTVHVCVNLTRPQIDILDETVNVFVVDNSSSVYIPAGDPLATPDPPNFLSQYLMIDGSDYAQQTDAVNAIDDTLVSELRRIVCYEQSIYDDLRLELDEYVGLTLGVRDNEMTTSRTEIRPMFDQASILIVDNDVAVVGLETTYYIVTENVHILTLCARVHRPDIPCPIELPFTVIISTVDSTAVSPSDYGAVNSMVLSFDTCERRSCINVNIVDDTTSEEEETFKISLTRTPNLDSRINLDPVSGEVTITETNEFLLVDAEVSESGPVEAGTANITLICTVDKIISGIAAFPSATWQRVSAEQISGDETTVLTEMLRNDTSASAILLLSPLHTSQAGLYLCQGRLQNGTTDIITASPLIPLTITLPTPNVTLNVPDSPFNEGSSLTLTCIVTLSTVVDNDVNVSVKWMPITDSYRTTISSPSSHSSPFVSTLTTDPLALTDAGQYSCKATAHSSSPYITASSVGKSQEQNITVTATDTPETGSSNVAVITGGIVAVIITLLIIITVIIAILVVKRRRGTFSLKNLPNSAKKENYIMTSTSEAYGTRRIEGDIKTSSNEAYGTRMLEGDIKTSTNEAYGVMQQGKKKKKKQKVTQRPPSSGDAVMELYEIPSPPGHATPSVVGTGQEDGEYEIISGE